MTTYYNQEEIHTAMKSLVKEYVADCLKCDELPEDFIDLIKHNFLAKYVCFNKDTQTIEVGVEDFSQAGLYPRIEVYKFPVFSNKRWIEKSFKSGRNDLQYYGRLLNRRKSASNDAEVIVM